MYFEGRELTPYSEPVSAEKLKEGLVYFSVTFIDDDMHIPIMDTLIFIGKNLEENDNEQIYFQDIHSYREGVRFESAAENDYASFFSCTADELNNIFEFERALDVLMRCLLRRKN